MSDLAIADRLLAFEAGARINTSLRVEGRVIGASGLSVEVSGIARHAGLGSRLILHGGQGRDVHAEVVGFRNGLARAMAFDELSGVGPGAAVRLAVDGDAPVTATLRSSGTLAANEGWLGRIVDPLGRPLDGRGPLPCGPRRPVRAGPPEATRRARLGGTLELGVSALDLFAPMRLGQRLGLFAGSGVGKSTLLSMLAREARCDAAVIALVGERGREVREFVEDDLGPDGLARSVVVVATSDTPPLMRREAAFAAMTVAEALRDEGKSVLLMMDSVTRFCLALREIGLSVGEPPATRGYPPSVFAELPRLLERAGPGVVDPARPQATVGSITGLFTVLVEGDDHSEPVADAVRGILDGHVVMDRRIGEAGRYPAIDVLRSLSRAAGGCHDPTDAALVARTRTLLSRWGDMADMVRLGAYRAGSDPLTDEAVAKAPLVEAVLRQAKGQPATLARSLSDLRTAMGDAHAT